MVRAILIDPVERTVSVMKVSERWNEIRNQCDGARLIRVATLPRGDGLYIAEDAKDSATFKLGGSRPYGGYGLVLGKRGEWGFICDALTDLNDVASLAGFETN